VQLVDARELWQKMRKSLGAKRKELSADHIAEITKLYGAFTEGERVKILPNEAFGFLRITVERPLQLRWEISAETLEAVRAERKLAKLAPEVVDHLVAALAQHTGLTGTDRAALAKTVDPVLRTAGLTAPQQRAVWDALAVRDPDAPVMTNRKGEPEPDPDLRDQENVPLPEVRVGYEEAPSHRLATIEYRSAVEDHLTTEVHPYVVDAWVDHSKTKIGYEIPLTRHFYRYVPPRPLEEIDAEIKQLEAEIQELLRQVTE
ncbi:MAG: SAM-dependent DNA methyltransferase, partial [Chloroflexi bacterium]|nr:SAM-dependent DNA methyltransferase [Chloroflexota bacterium]